MADQLTFYPEEKPVKGKARWKRPVSYEAHKAYIINRQREKRAYFQAILKQLICVDCGTDRWWLFDFHHRDGRGHRKTKSTREMSIGMIAANYKWERVLEELSRCDVLCANCHRERHRKEAR